MMGRTFPVTDGEQPHRAAPRHRRRRTRFQLQVVALATHGVLIWLVSIGFPDDLRAHGLLFVSVNYCVCALGLLLLRFRAYWPFFLLMYGIFWLIYVAKAIVQEIVGFDNPYVLSTIRVLVQPADFVRALLIVTVAHAIITAFVVFASTASSVRTFGLSSKAYLSNRAIRAWSIAFVLWLVLSSAVMMWFGVGVMGTEGVSLPFKLSGVLFYSRTVAMPLMLLYAVEKATVGGDRRLLRLALVLFVLLAVGEVIVRATKSPVFIMVLQVGFLYGLIGSSGVSVESSIRRRFATSLGMLLVAAIIAWPFMEAYRELTVSGLSARASAEATRYFAGHNGNLVIDGLDRLFQRMLGFLQLAGLVATPAHEHALSEVVSHGSIAAYYTHAYLGYSQIGHLSSPSLLGTALILGGSSFWPVVFVACLATMLIMWSTIRFLRNMAMPMACFLAAEFVNVVMAGTLDASLLRFVLAMSFCVFVEVLLRTVGGLRRLSVPRGPAIPG